jgi:hypothetical protein
MKRRSPIRTALIYVVFGALWIALSDIALDLILRNAPREYSLFQTIKGSTA